MTVSNIKYDNSFIFEIKSTVKFKFRYKAG